MALPSSPLEIDVMEDFMAAARAARATTSPLESESLSKRLCGTTTLTGATEEDTATLLALAHCTGWSADRIALAFNELRSTELTAEQVWDFHEEWMVKIKEESRSLDLLDIAVMKALVNKFGVSKVMFGTPLSETTRPITIKFAEAWSSIGADEGPLFPGFTTEAWKKSREYITAISAPSKYGHLTPVEEEVFTQFGPVVLFILKDSLKEWADDMWENVRKVPALDHISPRVQYKLIEQYLIYFQELYEQAFGMMGDDEKTINDGKVSLKSTGAGVKFVFNLMLLDRICHILSKHERERERKLRNARIGFEEVDVAELPDHSKDCPVCLDPIGAENLEGVTESAIKLVICCGQILGQLCLKKWLNEVNSHNQFINSCPMCRSEFSHAFIGKLFPGEEALTREAVRVMRRREREGAPAPELIIDTMPPPIPGEVQDRAHFVRSFHSLAQAIQRP